MSKFIRSLVALLAIVSYVYCDTGLAAADPPFAIKSIAAEGVRYETYLKNNWQPGQRNGRTWRISGDQLLASGKDPRAASRSYARAVVANGNDARAWLGLAR